MFTRISVVIRGAVQGVGFRPFIFRLASSMNLNGFVLNSPQGVFIEAEGEKNALDNFIIRIGKEKPVNSIIQSMEFSYLDPLGFNKFEIRQSGKNGKVSAYVRIGRQTRNCVPHSYPHQKNRDMGEGVQRIK